MIIQPENMHTNVLSNKLVLHSKKYKLTEVHYPLREGKIKITGTSAIQPYCTMQNQPSLSYSQLAPTTFGLFAINTCHKLRTKTTRYGCNIQEMLVSCKYKNAI